MNFGTYIWHNGNFIKQEEARINPIYHALHYGSGVFEGVRSYKTAQGSGVFRLEDHIKRFFYSASVIEMEIPYSLETLEEATRELLKKNNLEDSYIRPLATFGHGKMGLNPQGAEIDVFIAAWNWGKYLSEEPISVGVSPWIRIHPASLQADAKINGHYVNSILSSQWAHKNNYEEALLLDYQGNIAEGPGENIFIIKNQKVFTPKLGTILNGITRESIIKLCREVLNLEVEEVDLRVEDLENADEAFFTGTAAEVTIIKSLNQKIIGNQENTISESIKTLYNSVVRGGEPGYAHWVKEV